MAVDLHTGDTSLPYQFLPPSHDLNHSNPNNTNRSALNPQLLIPHLTTPLPHSAKSQRKDKDDDLVAELTHQMEMAHFMLQNRHKFDFSAIGSDNLESPWDSIDLPQSTLCSNQGSPEGLSPKKPSPPPSLPCWESTYDVVGMLEKMKLEERGSSKNHRGYGIPSMELETSHLSRLKQEQTLSLKKKLENHGHITQQFQKKGKGIEFDRVGFGNGRRRARPARTGPPQQQTGSEMQAPFLGGSGSRGTSCGTGVFLPRGGTSTPRQSHVRDQGWHVFTAAKAAITEKTSRYPA
ncbi:hypothetical protein SESBI_13340 [Sesbania bispinosa]|nr:hypothetical protein SESBI_13340 [Sesbania bispinosa]